MTAIKPSDCPYEQSSYDCPYGAESCPKITTLDKAIEDLTMSVRRLNYLMAFVAGIIAVECGIVIM